MYDPKYAPTFEDVELELQRVLNLTGLTRGAKMDKRIIGDMSHTYYIAFIHEAKDIEAVKAKVAGISDKFADLHFRVTESKNNFGESKGTYLRVGAAPPTDVSFAQQAIDRMIKNSDAIRQQKSKIQVDS